MAFNEDINISFFRANVLSAKVDWVKSNRKDIKHFTQIVWANGSPWREANLWLFERGKSGNLSTKTIASNATALSAYASWLESSETNWWDFPKRKSERCLVKYRGFLINPRSENGLSPSTVSSRMRTVVSFYRWLNLYGLLSPEWPMWEEKHINIPIDNVYGLQRTINVKSTDLSIPNRSRHENGLENGLLPVSDELKTKIIDLADRHASVELKFIILLGFYTGMRLGSICDLKIDTLSHAVPDPNESGIFWLSIGPSASPSAATKYGIQGQVIIPSELLKKLLDYAFSVRRLNREALSELKNKNLLFLTRYGNHYISENSNRSPSVNTEMHRLRAAGIREGLPINNFKFHQTRATFATSVAETAIKVGGPINAVWTSQISLDTK